MDENYKPRRGQKITKLYAWVAEEADGGEGICAGNLPGLPGITPLIGADRARIESYRLLAEAVASATGTKVRLKVFSNGTILDEL